MSTTVTVEGNGTGEAPTAEVLQHHRGVVGAGLRCADVQVTRTDR